MVGAGLETMARLAEWLRMALAVVWMFTAAGLSYWGYRVITD